MPVRPPRRRATEQGPRSAFHDPQLAAAGGWRRALGLGSRAAGGARTAPGEEMRGFKPTGEEEGQSSFSQARIFGRQQAMFSCRLGNDAASEPPSSSFFMPF